LPFSPRPVADTPSTDGSAASEERWTAREFAPWSLTGPGAEGPPDGNSGDQEESALGLIGERRLLRKGHDAGIRRRGSDTERPFGLDTPNPFPLVRSSPPRRLCRRRTGADRGEGSGPCGFTPRDPLTHPARRPANSRNAYSQALLECASRRRFRRGVSRCHGRIDSASTPGLCVRFARHRSLADQAPLASARRVRSLGAWQD
jgi:hypothetical protein